MGGFEGNEQMDMILDSSYTQRNPVQAMNASTQIFMKPGQEIFP